MTALQPLGSFGSFDTPAGSPPRPRGRALNRRQKAAIVIRVLLANGANISLADLPDDLQDDLTRNMGELGIVDRETVNTVIDEFVAEIENIGLSFPRGLDGALSLVGDALSPAAKRRLRQMAGPPRNADPWDRIAAMPIDRLVGFFETESTEVAAIILAKLPTEKAAALLGQLPGETARRVTYAVTQTESVAPSVVQTIGTALIQQIDAAPVREFEEPPTSRIGAILNVSASTTRDDMLESLEQTDAELAAEVRKAIFTYANIPARVAPEDVAAVIRATDRQDLLKAMAGARSDDETAVADFILANLSKRLAEQIRGELEDVGRVESEAAETAMTEVVAAIRSLEAGGEIKLKAPDG